jgi:hypothetical protein
MVYPTLAEFRVVTSRKFRICPASPNTFCNATVHVATLVTGAGSTVVQQGRECEYLADAVENLWEKMLEKAGGVVGKYCAMCDVLETVMSSVQKILKLTIRTM